MVLQLESWLKKEGFSREIVGRVRIFASFFARYLALYRDVKGPLRGEDLPKLRHYLPQRITNQSIPDVLMLPPSDS